MPPNIVKTERDERLWERAKAQAEKQGRSESEGDSFWAYVTDIFIRMRDRVGGGEREKKSFAQFLEKSRVRGHYRNVGGKRVYVKPHERQGGKAKPKVEQPNRGPEAEAAKEEIRAKYNVRGQYSVHQKRWVPWMNTRTGDELHDYARWWQAHQSGLAHSPSPFRVKDKRARRTLRDRGWIGREGKWKPETLTPIGLEIVQEYYPEWLELSDSWIERQGFEVEKGGNEMDGFEAFLKKGRVEGYYRTDPRTGKKVWVSGYERQGRAAPKAPSSGREEVFGLWRRTRPAEGSRGVTLAHRRLGVSRREAGSLWEQYAQEEMGRTKIYSPIDRLHALLDEGYESNYEAVSELVAHETETALTMLRYGQGFEAHGETELARMYDQMAAQHEEVARDMIGEVARRGDQDDAQAQLYNLEHQKEVAIRSGAMPGPSELEVARRVYEAEKDAEAAIEAGVEEYRELLRTRGRDARRTHWDTTVERSLSEEAVMQHWFGPRVGYMPTQDRLEKGRVKGHYRTLPSGKRVRVKAHERKGGKKAAPKKKGRKKATPKKEAPKVLPKNRSEMPTEAGVVVLPSPAKVEKYEVTDRWGKTHKWAKFTMQPGDEVKGRDITGAVRYLGFGQNMIYDLKEFVKRKRKYQPGCSLASSYLPLRCYVCGKLIAKDEKGGCAVNVHPRTRVMTAMHYDCSWKALMEDIYSMEIGWGGQLVPMPEERQPKKSRSGYIYRIERDGSLTQGVARKPSKKSMAAAEVARRRWFDHDTPYVGGVPLEKGRVRGHYRTLPDGKRVYVKPHERKGGEGQAPKSHMLPSGRKVSVGDTWHHADYKGSTADPLRDADPGHATYTVVDLRPEDDVAVIQPVGENKRYTLGLSTMDTGVWSKQGEGDAVQAGRPDRNLHGDLPEDVANTMQYISEMVPLVNEVRLDLARGWTREGRLLPAEQRAKQQFVDRFDAWFDRAISNYESAKGENAQKYLELLLDHYNAETMRTRWYEWRREKTRSGAYHPSNPL